MSVVGFLGRGELVTSGPEALQCGEDIRDSFLDRSGADLVRYAAVLEGHDPPRDFERELVSALTTIPSS